MAFLFCDSFDHLATADFLTKWSTKVSTPTLTAGIGRNSSSALDFASGLTTAAVTKNLVSASPTVIVGFARKPTGTASALSPFFAVGDATVTHLTVLPNADGTLKVLRGGTLSGTTLGTSLGNTTGTQTVGTYDYWEFQFLINDTTGTVTVRKNAVTVLTLTGQDTRNGGTAGWSWIGFGSNLNPASIDDVYVLDGTGAAPHNAFYGDMDCTPHYVNSDNTVSGGSTPSTGLNHFAMIDEALANGDTDYNILTSVNDGDTCYLQDLIPTGKAIVAFQTVLFAKKIGSAAGSICPVLHTGTPFDGTSVAQATTYSVTHQPYVTNPATGVTITEAAFNTLALGYKKTA